MLLKKAHNPYILACHLQIDKDPDPGPTFQFDADLDPANHFDADPDSDHTFKFDADPDPQTLIFTVLRIRIRDPVPF